MNLRIALSVIALSFLVAGCTKDEARPAPAPAPKAAEPAAAAAPAAAAPADDAATAKDIFANRCTPCHGPQGAGDGPASAGLTPKPRNFSDAAWQGSVTDEHVEKIVLYGGAAVGKSPAMPPNPDLNGKEGVVKALRAHIRALKK